MWQSGNAGLGLTRHGLLQPFKCKFKAFSHISAPSLRENHHLSFKLCNALQPFSHFLCCNGLLCSLHNFKLKRACKALDYIWILISNTRKRDTYHTTWGMQWCSWWRQCTTNKKVAGSIPDGVIGTFHWHNPSGIEVNSASNRNEHEEYLLGGKDGQCIGLTLLPSGSDHHEPWKPQPPGTHMPCPRIALPFTKQLAIHVLTEYKP